MKPRSAWVVGQLGDLYASHRLEKAFGDDGQASASRILARDLGQAVMQFDGFGELHEIRNEVEDRFGIVAAVWAHRRWIGLEDKTGAVWW